MHKGKISLLTIIFILVIFILVSSFIIKSIYSPVGTIWYPSLSAQINSYAVRLENNEDFIRATFKNTTSLTKNITTDIINNLYSTINDSTNIQTALRNILTQVPNNNATKGDLDALFGIINDDLIFLNQALSDLKTKRLTPGPIGTTTTPALTGTTTTPARTGTTTTPARTGTTTTPARTGTTTTPARTSTTTTPATVIIEFVLSNSTTQRADISGNINSIPANVVSVNLPKGYTISLYTNTNQFTSSYQNTTLSLANIMIPQIYNGLKIVTRYSISRS